MPRLVHFEIHATDPEKTIAFYEKVFGWTFQKWEGADEPYWLITTGPTDQLGPFVRLKDGTLLAITAEGAIHSKDEGKT